MNDILKVLSIKNQTDENILHFFRYSFVKMCLGWRRGDCGEHRTQGSWDQQDQSLYAIMTDTRHCHWHAGGRGRRIIMRLGLAWTAWSKSIHWAAARVVCVGSPADASTPRWGASAIGRLQPVMVSYGARCTSPSAFNCPPKCGQLKYLNP